MEEGEEKSGEGRVIAEWEEKGSEKDGKGKRKGKGVERKRKFFSGG